MSRRRAAKFVVPASLIAMAVMFGGASRAAQFPGRAPVVFTTILEGGQETPAISSRAIGEFRAALNRAENVLDYQFEFSGLEGGNTLFAHIHFGQRGVAGGVMVFLCGGGGKPACPNLEGTVTGTIDASNVIGPSGQGISAGEFDEAIHAMRSGLAYANLHTATFPGGEIRGQIEVIPRAPLPR
jgi:hypothetical protein